jgi:mRNA-degrading endonuclease toxin of MazEF toxin-antitoxin module
VQKNPKEGEVWVIGETEKPREEEERIAVVLSEPELRRLPLRVTVPLKKWIEHKLDCAWMVSIAPVRAGLKQSGHALTADAKQCCALAVDHFMRKLGTITPEELRMIREAVALCIGIRVYST